jgi:hypothetical protein
MWTVRTPRNYPTLLKSPLVLPPDFFFLFRGKVILDVEGLPYLLRGFTLDHVRHSLTSQIKQVLDIQVISGLEKERLRYKQQNLQTSANPLRQWHT